MYKPAGIIDLENKITQPKTKIPKPLVVYFFILNSFCGIDFGFIKLLPLRHQQLAKFISVFASISNVIILIPPFNDRDDGINAWYSIILSQYVAYFFILRFAKYNVYDFMTEAHNINEGDNVTELNKVRLGAVASTYTIVFIFVKSSTFLAYCIRYINNIDCDSYFAPHYLYIVLHQSLDVIPIIQTLTYYYIYCCVKYLKELLNISDIDTVQKHYVAISDCLDKIKPLYDNLMMVKLLFEIPKSMGTLWNMLRSIKMNDGWLGYINQSIYWCPILIHICAPAVIAEMVASQYDNIRLILHYRLLNESDDKKILDINRLLRYMKARSLQHKAWRIVPIDMRLPVSIISICVTYFIVIIQFTHLYG